jgi:hypothetical protein
LGKTDESLKRIARRRVRKQDFVCTRRHRIRSSNLQLVEKSLPLADIKRVYIAGGINTTEGSGYNEYHVPKGQLISGLMAAFDSKSIYLTRRSKESIKLLLNWPSLKYILLNPAAQKFKF